MIRAIFEFVQSNNFFIMTDFETIKTNGLVLNNEIDNLPFLIKRVYWISGVPDGTIRGTHAHRECEEIVHILNGYVKVELVDKNGQRNISTFFDGQHFYIPTMVWKAITFYQDAKLVVYASTEYNSLDYIYESEFFNGNDPN